MSRPSISRTWLELSVETDHEAVEPVSELFARFGYNEGVAIEEPFTQDPDGDNLAVDHTRPVVIRTFVSAADVTECTLDEIRQSLWHLGQLRAVGELQIVEREEEDWANAWKAHFRPLRAGRRTVIVPPWHDYFPDADDDVVVVLDPGMAFGTGTHPSTRLCLMAIEEHLREGDRVLDVGTGSGVLAIAAIKLGAAAAEALDIEPVAVRSAVENAERNNVANSITVSLGSVTEPASGNGPYDVVIANIISRVLIELAAGLSAATRPGGLLILSGVIEQRESLVRDAFEPRGFVLVHRGQIDDWIGLVYRAPE